MAEEGMFLQTVPYTEFKKKEREREMNYFANSSARFPQLFLAKVKLGWGNNFWTFASGKEMF